MSSRSERIHRLPVDVMWAMKEETGNWSDQVRPVPVDDRSAFSYEDLRQEILDEGDHTQDFSETGVTTPGCVGIISAADSLISGEISEAQFMTLIELHRRLRLGESYVPLKVPLGFRLSGGRKEHLGERVGMELEQFKRRMISRIIPGVYGYPGIVKTDRKKKRH